MAQAVDDLAGASAAAFDLALPLVLERGGADDEDAFDAEVLGHDLGGGDGLDGLAEAHLVADEAAAGAGGEEDALALVVVERDLEQVLERRRCGCRADTPQSMRWRRCSPSRTSAMNVSTSSKQRSSGSRVRGLAEKRLETPEGIGQQAAIDAEIPAGQARQLDGAGAAGPEADLAAGAVLKVDLAGRRLIAGPQLGDGAGLLFQNGQA